MNFKAVKGMVLTVLCFVLLITAGIPCEASETGESAKQTVRVAYFDMGNYYTVGNGGNVISYDTDELNRIAEYSNLTFEYVDCGTWSNALVMLKNHEVDLVGTAQWNKEREEEYEYCLESYGYTVGEMATLPSNPIIYEDYDAIGRSVVGCTESYVRMDEMNEVFAENGIAPVIKTYANQEELEKALITGEIDIIASNSHTMHDEWNVVDKFSYSPFYFISWKGNEQLTDTIDSAIIRQNLREPNADDELMNKYFPNLLGEPLTKEEIDLINEGKTYTVYYSTDIKPLAWYDEDTDTMKGALIDACAQVTENTGLEIEVRPDWEAPESQGVTTIKYTTLFADSTQDISSEPGVTDALIDEPFNLFHKAGKTIEKSLSGYSIAIVGKRNRLEGYIQEKYPECEVCCFDSPLECIKELEAGRVDLAYLSVHIADNELTELAIDDIRELPVDEQINGIGMYFQGEDSALLESIVNKGIQKIDQTEISDAMVQYALSTTPKMSLRTIIQDYTGMVAAGAAIIVGVLLIMVFLLTYANVMRKQRDRVEKADADRSEFFARMSHDMRTPMNGILGMIELTKESTDLGDIHANMGKAKASSEYMLGLINDTLDLQRLESGKMKLNPEIVYAKEYFEDVFSMMRISAEKKHLEFRVDNVNMELDKYIEIDRIRVKQIFTNLLSNAIKFTPENGMVEVIMECLGSEGEVSHKKFQIIDTGVGMSADFIKNRIYKPYSQENNELTAELTGTGLGLAITKNLIDIMGGRMEVESEPGEGTIFTFYIDFKNVSEEAAKEEEKKRSRKADVIQAELVGKHILLCEDHPLNAEIAKRLLQKAGCDVIWAENGEIGVQKVADSEESYFDAILMDIRMPVMDGIQAAKEIRKLERKDAKRIPIIAMTANAYDSDIKSSLAAGMNAHLAKPVEPQALYAEIAKQIRQVGE